MTPDLFPLLVLAVFLVALLYSSVGHAGASGYIAVMALFDLAPAHIKPVALTLNVIVASITTWQFWRAGHFSWRLFWPFALASMPCAYLGGALTLPVSIFKFLVGVALLASAARFLARPADDPAAKTPSIPTSLSVGGVLGLLAGLTGTGGGIFLTPVLLFMRWARTKNASAVSALFILVNSISGLLGAFRAGHGFPGVDWPLAAAVIAGGAVGSGLGSGRLEPATIKRLLSAVLTLAGLKLVFAF